MWWVSVPPTVALFESDVYYSFEEPVFLHMYSDGGKAKGKDEQKRELDY